MSGGIPYETNVIKKVLKKFGVMKDKRPEVDSFVGAAFASYIENTDGYIIEEPRVNKKVYLCLSKDFKFIFAFSIQQDNIVTIEKKSGTVELSPEEIKAVKKVLREKALFGDSQTSWCIGMLQSIPNSEEYLKEFVESLK